jgi:hypothetical protein
MKRKRPECPLCKGKGSVRGTAFNKTLGATRVRSCHGCQGKGVLRVMVDVYDVLEALDAIGTGASGSMAVFIEKRFGIDAPEPSGTPKKDGSG